MKIGFIGLGRMGKSMAKRLLNREYEVVGWNRTREKALSLVKYGLELVDSPKVVGKETDIIFIMVSDIPAIENILHRNNGLLEGLKANSIVVNSSTILPSFSIKLAEKLKQSKAKYVEAPVLGGPRDAEEGKLITLVGADKNIYDVVKPILEDLSEKIYYLGEVGKASAMKLIFNMVAPSALILLGEAINLGERAGLEVDKIIEILSLGPLKSVIERYFKKMMTQKVPSTFSLKLMTKDLQYAVQMAYELGMPLFIPSLAENIYRIALAKGMGEEYHARVYDILREISGLPLIENK